MILQPVSYYNFWYLNAVVLVVDYRRDYITFLLCEPLLLVLYEQIVCLFCGGNDTNVHFIQQQH